MPRKRKNSGLEATQKILLYGVLLSSIILVLFIFGYYTYYEWGQEEDVTWLTHAQ
jgi:hypothetical protein